MFHSLIEFDKKMKPNENWVDFFVDLLGQPNSVFGDVLLHIDYYHR